MEKVRQEHERLIQKQQEDAVQRHFEESLRLHNAKKMRAASSNHQQSPQHPLAPQVQSQTQRPSQAHHSQSSQVAQSALAGKQALPGVAVSAAMAYNHAQRPTPSQQFAVAAHQQLQLAEAMKGQARHASSHDAISRDTQQYLQRQLEVHAAGLPQPWMLPALQQQAHPQFLVGLPPFPGHREAPPCARLLPAGRPGALDAAREAQFSLYGYHQGQGRPTYLIGASQPPARKESSSQNGGSAAPQQPASSAFAAAPDRAGHSAPGATSRFLPSNPISTAQRLPPPAHAGSLPAAQRDSSPSPLHHPLHNHPPHRSLTPDSRSSTSLWRPPSLSPKRQSASLSPSPHHHLPGARASPHELKATFDGRSSAPPAHQSSSSPLTLPGGRASASQVHVQPHDQPENLVLKVDGKSKGAKCEGSRPKGAPESLRRHHHLHHEPMTTASHQNRTSFVPQGQQLHVPQATGGVGVDALRLAHQSQPPVNGPAPPTQAARTKVQHEHPPPAAPAAHGAAQPPKQPNFLSVAHLISQAMSYGPPARPIAPVQAHAVPFASTFAPEAQRRHPSPAYSTVTVHAPPTAHSTFSQPRPQFAGSSSLNSTPGRPGHAAFHQPPAQSNNNQFVAQSCAAGAQPQRGAPQSRGKQRSAAPRASDIDRSRLDSFRVCDNEMVRSPLHKANVATNRHQHSSLHKIDANASPSGHHANSFIPVQFGQPDKEPLDAARGLQIKQEPVIADNNSSNCSTPKLSCSPTNTSGSPQLNTSASSSAPNLKKKWLQRHTEGDSAPPSLEATPMALDATPVRIKVEKNDDVREAAADAGDAASFASSVVKSENGSCAKTSPVAKVNGTSPGEKGKPSRTDETTDSGSETDTAKETPSAKKAKKEASARKRSLEPAKEKKRKKQKREPDGDESAKDARDARDAKSKEKEKERDAKRSKKKRAHKERAAEKASPHAEGADNKTDVPEKTPKRRGRKPRDEKSKEKVMRTKDPVSRPSRREKKAKKPSPAALRQSGEPFLQNDSCGKSAPKLPKCRECRSKKKSEQTSPENIFCRFYEFRKLRYGKSEIISSPGFSEPGDATDEDFKLWLPLSPPANPMSVEEAKYILQYVGDHFCNLVNQERMAEQMHLGDKRTAWKKVVSGVREMCDVCETTLFNVHWVCNKCGFVVCIDCYSSRLQDSKHEVDGETDSEKDKDKERDRFEWLYCNGKQAHDQSKLMLTQIVANKALFDLGQRLHETKDRLRMPSTCRCKANGVHEQKENKATSQLISQHLLNAVLTSSLKENHPNGVTDKLKAERRLDSGQNSGYNSDARSSPLSFLADVAINSERSQPGDSTPKPSDDEEPHSQLRDLLVGSSAKKDKKGRKANGIKAEKNGAVLAVDKLLVAKHANGRELEKRDRSPLTLQINDKPPRVVKIEDSKREYPNAPHEWLCEGRLLVLKAPHEDQQLNHDQQKLFQDQWSRNQPVLVSDNHQSLDKNLWTPARFSKVFGDAKHVVVDCCTGNELDDHSLRHFWNGFEDLRKRQKSSETQKPMILKLKDYPPGDDFGHDLPQHFADVMRAFPISPYTKLQGGLNLAGRLPETFVRPDLGPKMYVAYGPALPDKGTTNLHLDISDALNLMCYVGIPKIKKGEAGHELDKEITEAVKANCDPLMVERVLYGKDVRVGALWHIYDARDATAIRKFLNKVAKERDAAAETQDAIHDQTWYLDDALRARLKSEYDVEGYAIAQCLGDAVFIPAGAPHQVRNLNSCIKLAADFVSPENVAHCFNLTEQFRKLSDTHLNHQDKLQIKNIIYHAVKDSLAVLNASAGEPTKPTLVDSDTE